MTKDFKKLIEDKNKEIKDEYKGCCSVSKLCNDYIKIKFDDEETYNIAVYDKKLNFLDSNYETWGVYTTSPKYSMSVNSTYYVVVKSRTEDTVLTNINFVEAMKQNKVILIKIPEQYFKSKSKGTYKCKKVSKIYTKICL